MLCFMLGAIFRLSLDFWSVSKFLSTRWLLFVLPIRYDYPLFVWCNHSKFPKDKILISHPLIKLYPAVNKIVINMCWEILRLWTAVRLRWSHLSNFCKKACIWRKTSLVESTSLSYLEAHAGFFRVSMKRKFDVCLCAVHVICKMF